MPSRAHILTAGSAVIILSGLTVAMAAWPPLAGLAALFIDILFWPLDGAQSLAAPETRLLSAIGGGVMAGWGLMMLLVVRQVLPAYPALAKRLLLPPLCLWFAADSLFSLAAGAPLNVIGNLAFAAAVYLPLRSLR